MERFNIGQQDIFKIEVDESVKSSFLEMARWTKFLAILGFVTLALFLLLGIIIGIYLPIFAESMGGPSATAIASLGAAGPVIIITVFAVVIGVYIYPTYALLRYSRGIKSALANENKDEFKLAIRYLKNMFKYLGILTIIFLSLYGVQLIFAVLGSIGK